MAPIPDHASKFKTWRDQVRAEVSNFSKAGQKAYLWIMRVEEERVSDDALRVTKKKWEPLDGKLRAVL